MDDDIIENNCNNSDISEISKIIALLFHLCKLYHYYFYSGVGPGALLQREHVISLLYHYYARLVFIIPYTKWGVIIRYYDMLFLLLYNSYARLVFIIPYTKWCVIIRYYDMLFLLEIIAIIAR